MLRLLAVPILQPVPSINNQVLKDSSITHSSKEMLLQQTHHHCLDNRMMPIKIHQLFNLLTVDKPKLKVSSVVILIHLFLQLEEEEDSLVIKQQLKTRLHHLHLFKQLHCLVVLEQHLNNLLSKVSGNYQVQRHLPALEDHQL
jgi:hypothetical protein